MHTNDPEPRSKKKQKKPKKHSNARWIVTIFFVAVLISSAISFLSSSVMEDAGIVEAFIVLLIIVLLGIVFDIVGVAVMSAGEKPFHSMAAKKVPGAAEALMLLRNAAEYLQSFFFNDDIPFWLVIFGSAGQIIFTLRFVYQYFYSQRKHQSALPAGFWIISLIGSSVIIAYGLFRRDPVLILGQSFGFVAYIRNLMIGFKERKNEVRK